MSFFKDAFNAVTGADIFKDVWDTVSGNKAIDAQQAADEENKRLAIENREWQLNNTNTAYQRAAVDLEKAGLNRVLALGSPAASPAAGPAKVEGTGHLRMEQSKNMTSSALNAATTIQGIKTSASQAQLNTASAQQAAETAKRIAMENSVIAKETDIKGKILEERKRQPGWEFFKDTIRQGKDLFNPFKGR